MRNLLVVALVFLLFVGFILGMVSHPWMTIGLAMVAILTYQVCWPLLLVPAPHKQ